MNTATTNVTDVSPVEANRVNAYVTTTRRGRYYSWRDENFWSVTTMINGGVPKGDVLVNWAKKFTAEYACDNFEQLRQLLTPRGGSSRDIDLELAAAQIEAIARLVEIARTSNVEIDRELALAQLRAVAVALQSRGGYVDRDAAVQWLKDAAYRDRDRKGQLGEKIHDAIEAYVLGQPFPKWTPDILPRMNAFERFLARYEPNYEIGMTEASVFNRSHRYAGRADTVFEIGRGPHKGRRVLNDYKSGGKDVYPEAALQLAAYRRAEFVGAPDGSEQPMPPVDMTTVLWLPDDGEFRLVEVATTDDVFRAFLYVRENYRWADSISKGVVLGNVASDPPQPASDAERELANELARSDSPHGEEGEGEASAGGEQVIALPLPPEKT